MIICFLLLTAWIYALSPSSMFSSLVKAHVDDKKYMLFYAIDPQGYIYFAKNRELLRSRLHKLMKEAGVTSIKHFHARGIDAEILREFPCPKEFKKLYWDLFLDEIKFRIECDQVRMIANYFPKDYLPVLGRFFRSIPDDRCQKFFMKDPRREKNPVERIFLLLSKDKAHFAQSAASLRASMQNSEGVCLLSEELFDSFQVHSVSLDDLRSLKGVPELYKKEWSVLLGSGNLLGWASGGAEYLRKYILDHMGEDKVQLVSHEDFLKSYKDGMKDNKGICFYQDLEHQLFYMNRDFYDLRKKLERDVRVGEIRQPIYYISEDMLRGTSYARFIKGEGSGSSSVCLPRTLKVKARLIKGLLEHFKGKPIIHEQSPIQESKEGDGVSFINEGMREGEFMDRGGREDRGEEREGEQVMMDRSQMMNRGEGEDRGEERGGEQEMMDINPTMGSMFSAPYQEDIFYIACYESPIYMGIQEEKVWRFLFMNLSFDQFFLENFFDDFHVSSSRIFCEIENVYSCYLQETTPYNWIRYLLHFSFCVPKEYIFNLAVLFYGQKVLQETGREEGLIGIYFPEVDYHKLYIKLKREVIPLVALFHHGVFDVLCCFSSVNSCLDGGLMCQLLGVNREAEGENVDLLPLPVVTFSTSSLFACTKLVHYA